MVSVNEKLKGFVRHRWVVFVCSMWDLSFAGTAYMFGSISPVIKSSMGYNQQQVAFLSVAKDLGDNVGIFAGKISEVSPTWVVTLVGVVQNLVGYGLVWLVVTHKLPSLPLWMLCIFIFVGQNGATYYNTSALVSSVKSFPLSRGPVVGILKGFIGLSGAIWTQIIAMINFPDQASLIFIIAVGPAIVSCALMFIIRPVGGGYKQSRRASDGAGFVFIYSICLLLAVYLMAVLLLENTLNLDHKTITLFAVILIILILLPIMVPIMMVFFSESKSLDQETLLEPPILAASGTNIAGHVEDDDDKPPMLEDYFKKIRNRPCLGEDFALSQALANGDFWILFLSLLMGSGSGLTMINNMGQICQSLGDNNANVYISVISIFNFLGRVAGGYFSEVILRNFAYPRLAALVVVQWMMALGLSYYAMGLVGQVYVIAISMGFGFGAHWAIALAATSELFGLKNFGTMFNFLTISNPIGSLFFSGFVASKIYDYYAEQQAKQRMQTHGAMHNVIGSDGESIVCEGNTCFSLTCGIFAVLCILASVLSLILVHRTKRFYAQLHRKSLT